MTLPALRRLQPIGPSPASIAIVGDFPSEHDAQSTIPFSGPSGQELTRMLADAGISRKDCYFTYVFPFRPAEGKIESICGKKAEVGGKAYVHPGISSGKYILPEHLHELDRLQAELASVSPNVVVALGGVASWALLGSAKISSIRGTVSVGDLCAAKVLPTHSSGTVLKQWSLRVIVVADLQKARKESAFPEVKRKRRELWLEPTLEDIEEFFHRFIGEDEASLLSFDIETKQKQITCIGFAPSDDRALVIPFVDSRKPGQSYWPSVEAELLAWEWVRRILSHPRPKLAQNGLYDIQYLWKVMGLPVRNFLHDTMILHHSLYVEMQKGLGFLGSIYCNESAWKDMRKASGSNKRDE